MDEALHTQRVDAEDAARAVGRIVDNLKRVVHAADETSSCR